MVGNLLYCIYVKESIGFVVGSESLPVCERSTEKSMLFGLVK